MALTRPRITQFDTSISSISDPITVLKAGTSAANIDIGFIMNRANGLVSNVALYWNESGNTFVTAFTSSNGSGAFSSNITPTGFANISAGAVTITPVATLNSTSTTTGALVVTGGAGVSGAVYAGSVYDSSSRVITSATITAGTGISGGGTISGPSGSVTLTNTGVLVITTGAGISANSSTGTVSLTNTGVLSVSTGTGISANVSTGSISLTNTGVTSLSGTANQITASASTGSVTLSFPSTVNLTTLNAATIGNVSANVVGTGTYLTSLSGGNITSGSVPNSALTNNSITVTAGTGMSGGGTVSLGGSVTLTNAGVTSLSAGSGISVSAATGGVSVTNTGVLSLSSSGTGNITVSASTGSISLSLPLQGPGATTIGSSSAIPVITTDLYGRIATITTASISTTLNTSGTSGTGSVALSNQSLTFAGSNGVTATASGQTITIGTPQDLQTTASPTFNNGTFNGNVNVSGTLTVANLQARGSINVVVQDPMMYLQANVLYPWNYDTGIYSDSIGGPANTYVHHGMVRSISNGYWGFFSNVKSEPDATINWNDAGLIWDTIRSGDIVSSNTTVSTSTTTGALRVAGGAGIAGNLFVDKVYTTNGIYWAGNGFVMSTGGGSSPAGTLGQMQYNNGGTLGAAAMYYWSGNTNITTGGLYGTLYDTNNRVLTSISSSGAGNLTVSGSAPSLTISLPATGPGATTVGSSTSIPVITTDAYGRIASLTSSSVSTTINLSGTSGTGSVSGGGTLTFTSTNGVTATVSGSTVTINDPQDIRTSASPTFAGGNFTGNVTRSSRTIVTNYSGNVAPASPLMGDEWFRGNTGVMYKYLYDNVSNTYNWINISSALYNASTSATASTLALRDSGGNLTATNFLGTASSAKYADLAEIYTSDKNYEPGTVVVFGGTAEITSTKKTHDTRVAGVISTNPAYLMNSEAIGLPVAFTGRVPCKVHGPVSKGDILVTSAYAEYAERMHDTLYRPGCILGKALGEAADNEFTTIEVVVGRF